MRRVLQRLPSLLARNSLLSPAKFHHYNTNPRVVSSLERVTSPFVFFSSNSDSSPGSKLDADEVVSKEELKKRIKSFLDDGDEDALPDLFEAMMNRKLSGKHDESDDEVMEEVRKYPVNDDAHKVDATDSDAESSDGDSSDSDVESDRHSRDGDSSDSDVESDGHTRDGDSSDSDCESDSLSDDDSSDSDIESDGQSSNHSSDSDSDSESD